MKVLIKNEERDYRASGGLFNSGMFQDVYILSEDKKQLAYLLVNQTYSHRNKWGVHEIKGFVNVKMAQTRFLDWFEDKYGEMSLSVVNELFKPLEFTENGDYREVEL